jgi:dipeptidase
MARDQVAAHDADGEQHQPDNLWWYFETAHTLTFDNTRHVRRGFKPAGP